MSTPNWDILHLRFASSVRDAVSTAATDGSELVVADRDGYLNYGYSKFIRMIAENNPDQIDEIVTELFKIADVTATAGVITLPADFGFYVDLASPTAGTVITNVKADEFLNIKSTSTVQSPPDTDNIYITQSTDGVLMLPITTAGTFYLAYIISQGTITQGGGTDIILSDINFEPVIQLARAQYYRDKQEFSIADAIENDQLLRGLKI